VLKLTDEQKKMFEGGYGRGVQKAMSMLVDYGNVFGARRMIRVDSVHTFNNDPLDFLKQMLDGVDEVRVFSSLHSVSPPATRWARPMGIRMDLVERETKVQKEREAVFCKAGFLPTYTCVPYLSSNMLRRGMIYSWPGSSGIIIGNSLFGAMANRDAGPASLSSAITGLTPEMMLTVPENRYAELLVRIEGLDMDKLSAGDYGALGYYIGPIAGLRKVAVTGIPAKTSFEKMKYFLSPMPVSGAVSLCHIVGMTPEAPTLKAAFGGHKPEVTITVGKKELEEGYRRLNTAKTRSVDAVFFGCPHCTISEIKRISQLLNGKRVRRGVRFWVATAESIYSLAKRMGFVYAIEEAGGLVVTDMCIVSFPFALLDEPVKVVATDSARAAHYQARGGAAGGGGVSILYGSTEQCVVAAIQGTWRG
jgi:cis-L-3-hydroxyproline dehydratase